LLRAKGEAEEEDRERGEWEIFLQRVVGGMLRTAAGDEAEEQEDVRQSEEDEGDPEVEQQMCVKGVAVQRGVPRQMP
jgi:hypothetical protein